jgi:ribosomal 50S subunit-associated protein YjgA (DUF615 family)
MTKEEYAHQLEDAASRHLVTLNRLEHTRAVLAGYMALADLICYAEPELSRYRTLKRQAQKVLKETPTGSRS